MSYVADLIEAYKRFVSLPWQHDLAPAQRVWMAVYPPEHERRIRLHLPEFAGATQAAGHGWAEVDLTGRFEQWMATHEYREEYFGSPDDLDLALPEFFDELCAQVRGEIASAGDAGGVVALIGAGALFGLGDAVKVSALLN